MRRKKGHSPEFMFGNDVRLHGMRNEAASGMLRHGNNRREVIGINFMLSFAYTPRL